MSVNEQKQEYIAVIAELLTKCEDIGLLDLIYRLLQKSREQGRV